MGSLPSADGFRALVRHMDEMSHFLPVDTDQKIERLGAGVQRWEIDSSRSNLTFSLPHLIVQKVRGQFDRWGGTLVIYPKQQRLSNVEIWVISPVSRRATRGVTRGSFPKPSSTSLDVR